MKLSLFIFLATFLFNSFITTAQKNSSSIKGRIFDAEGKPAANINIELQKIKRIAVTDDNGFFILQHLPALKDTLIISSIDSKSTIREINLERDQTIDLGIIRLEYNVKQLQFVEIKGRE